jgi:hypothetical protein
MSVETVFLDAGGVLVFPNWARISGAMTDHQRGWQYFNLILEGTGLPLTAQTDAALAELHAYHAVHNLRAAPGAAGSGRVV